MFLGVVRMLADGCSFLMMFCDLNDSAAVSDELLRRHVSFGVIGLPADDFKVRDWLRRSRTFSVRSKNRLAGCLMNAIV